MSHHTFAEGQLFLIHHQLRVGTHSCCMEWPSLVTSRWLPGHTALQATNTATSHAKDGQHEMPGLGDHTYLTTADIIIIIQSHKRGVLSYHFWAANTQEVISN